MTAAFLALPAAAVGLGTPAPVTKTFNLTGATEDLMVYVDQSGDFGIKPARELALDASQSCRHNSVTPGSAIAPIEIACSLTDGPSVSGWTVGWNLPPAIAAGRTAYVGDTFLDFSGSNAGHLTFSCNWSWIPPVDQTVACTLNIISGFPFGTVTADFECNADGSGTPGGIGAWEAILFTFP